MYSYNFTHSCVINMKLLSFKDFMKKYNLKNDTMNESELQSVYNYPIYASDSKVFQIKDLLI